MGRGRPEPAIDDGVAIGRLIREMGTQSLLRTKLIADALGMPTSNTRAFELLFLGGPQSAGEIGARLGLTSGSVTTLVNRLIDAGIVTREFDPDDRRRVLITLIESRALELFDRFRSTSERLEQPYRRFSPAELATVHRFMAAFQDESTQATLALKEELTEPRRVCWRLFGLSDVAIGRCSIMA